MSTGLGFLASLISLTVVFYGLPIQILKNYQNRSCRGLSLELVVVTFFAYSTWSAYGLTKPDWFLFASQTPGAILALLIILQFVRYEDLVRRIKKVARQGWEDFRCTCPKECDCEMPKPDNWKGGERVWRYSNNCPIHNEEPEPDPDCPIHGDEWE